MPDTSPSRPRSHGKLPRFLTAGEGTDGTDEHGDVDVADVGSRKGGPNANNVPVMGAGARCGSHPPYDPDGIHRRVAGSGVGRPSPYDPDGNPASGVARPSLQALPPERDGVAFPDPGGRGNRRRACTTEGSSWRHRSSRRIKLP